MRSPDWTRTSNPSINSRMLAVFPGNLQNTGHSAGSRGVHKEPYLAALCAELAAAHFQLEELTLYRFELFVVGVCAELL